MKKQSSLVLAATLALAAAAAACQKDPNVNSMIFTGGAGNNGTDAGGAGGSGPVTGPIPGMAFATFATGAEGFVLNQYDEAANLARHNNGTVPTISWDSAVGSPDNGSLKVTAPYSGANQYVDIQKAFTTTPMDWSNRTLYVRIKVSEGTFTGGIQPYVNTGNFVFGGTFTNAVRGSDWQEYRMMVSAPTNGAGASAGSGYDATKVVQVGIQINTGQSGGTATPVVFNIDSISINPPVAGSGGGDGGPEVAPEAGTAGDASSEPTNGNADGSGGSSDAATDRARTSG